MLQNEHAMTRPFQPNHCANPLQCVRYHKCSFKLGHLIYTTYMGLRKKLRYPQLPGTVLLQGPGSVHIGTVREIGGWTPIGKQKHMFGVGEHQVYPPFYTVLVFSEKGAKVFPHVSGCKTETWLLDTFCPPLRLVTRSFTQVKICENAFVIMMVIFTQCTMTCTWFSTFSRLLLA